MVISLDTETTGIDLYKGAKPFYVVSCDERGNVSYWEWEVNYKTRQPNIPQSDIEDIKNLVGLNRGKVGGVTLGELLILQNAKFDIAALAQLDDSFSTQWPYERTFDTLLAAHLLTSNRPKDLTTLALQYLNVNIAPLEERIKKACEEARREARKLRKKGEQWNIAEKGNPMMPSAKEKCWKFDMWLPRAIARYFDYKPSHYFWTALQDYSNADAEITVSLYPRMMEEIRRRKLGKIFDTRLKIIPITHQMEKRGVTISAEKLNVLQSQYEAETKRSETICVNIAAGLNHKLSMPKGNTPNNSLKHFIYKVLKLEPTKSKKSKTNSPSLDSEVLQHYVNTLPHRSVEQKFVKEMLDKRTRDTAIVYMKGYRRFWNPLTIGGPDDKGHHLLTPQECKFDKESGNCPVCEYGLGVCRNCGMAEVELRNQCPKSMWFVLHPFLNPTGTDTVRWSSSNPNEQNISKRKGFNLRYCFGPAPGREWWSVDAKNIELRLPAYEAGEDDMIALFERPDDPPYYGSNHMLVFHLLWPELWDKAAKEVGEDKAGPHCKKVYASTYYQWIKNGNFAVQYGAIERPDGWGTADVSYHQQYSHRKVKAKFSKMAKLNDWCIKFAEKHGYIETIPDKEIDPDRGYPLLCTRTDWGNILPTVPLNYRIQGSACWWMMKGMLRCAEQLNEWNRELSKHSQASCIRSKPMGEMMLGYHIAMQVHDELVFDFPQRANPRDNPKESNLGMIQELVKLMEKGGEDFGIPTPCGIEFHDNNWSEGITLG
jgi:DNA polymerase I-like protein with 3'-5' exonuclease and polymerase domains